MLLLLLDDAYIIIIIHINKNDLFHALIHLFYMYSFNILLNIFLIINQLKEIVHPKKKIL